jgi:hypothetical protein
VHQKRVLTVRRASRTSAELMVFCQEGEILQRYNLRFRKKE